MTDEQRKTAKNLSTCFLYTTPQDPMQEALDNYFTNYIRDHTIPTNIPNHKQAARALNRLGIPKPPHLKTPYPFWTARDVEAHINLLHPAKP